MFILAYGVFAYTLFFVTFLYAIGFVENLLVPKSIDTGMGAAGGSSVALAVAVNVALLGLFAVQHTIMARPAFKRWWTTIIPKAAERSTFVVATCICFILMFWLWRPIDGILWQVDAAAGRAVLYAISLAGFGIVFYTSFLINHFDLFGLRQVFLHWRRRPYTHVPFKSTWLYRLVRNPLMLGFLIAFWATPDMSYGHLLFSVVVTAYILVGIQFEERDLARHLGEDYRRYRERTPMILPWPRKRGANQAVQPFSEPA